MSRVFIVQQPLQRDRKTGELRKKFDTSPANMFGELIELLSPSAQPFTDPGIIEDLSTGLRDFADDDWLLCIGSPVLIGWATAIAAHHNGGRVQMLQWHGLDEEYIPVKANLRFT